MPITNNRFRDIIFNVLDRSAPNAVAIEEFYKGAEQSLEFDAHDLAYTKSRNKKTKEPNWKRNLRNALQGLKGKGGLANVSMGIWNLPIENENPLDVQKAWTLIKGNAETALRKKQIWESTIEKKQYEVDSITDNKIVLRRKSTDTIQELSKRDVEKAIRALNTAGGTIGRRAMIYTVAKEVAIVHFHQGLRWSDDFKSIHAISHEIDLFEKTIRTIEEAKDDDINSYQNYARRIRKGQAKLRANLLEVYNGKCCISATGPDNVLQAAHIDAHSQTGSNHSTNALLLRSDLHDLFDDGLLLIHPQTLTIRIHPSLRETLYFEFENKPLAKRSDGLSPDIEILSRRWETLFWGNGD